LAGRYRQRVEILDVDLLAFEKGDAPARAAVVAGVRRSLATGFVYVAHDLSQGFLDEVYETLTSFFALPDAEKRGCEVPESNGQAGYTGLAVETAASSETPDWKEMLNWSAEIPPDHPLRTRYPHRYLPPSLPEEAFPGATSLLLEFHSRVLDLQRRFLRIIALGVGAPEDAFEPMLENGATLTRAIHYPEMAISPSKEHVWAAEHGDINLITALPRATAPGLQVKTAAGWTDAAPAEDRAILNTGMMLEHLTNGVLPTGRHRVVAQPGQASDRLSVVQFCHPTPATILTPFESCVNEGSATRFESTAAGAWLDQVLYEINLVENRRRIE
jgi:isopenicillin N synthase-like dioxygenase